MEQTYNQFLQQLNITIPKYDDRDSKQTQYQISIQFKNGKFWTVDRTYQEFQILHDDLSKATIQLPDLPPKTKLFSLSSAEKDQRRQDLEKFLRFLMYRKDILTSRLFKEFIKMQQSIPEEIFYKEKAKLQYHHKFPVYDVHYVPDQQVIFVLIGSHSIKNKVGGFFSGLASKDGAVNGSVICYRSQFKNYEFDVAWKHDFSSGPTKMVWDPKLTILSVGLMNGNIVCLRVSTEKQYSQYIEFCQIKRHRDQITGLEFNSRTAELYSIGKDRQLNVTNIANDNILMEEKLFPTIINCLEIEKQNNRLFLGGQDGTVFIYHIVQNQKLKPLHKIEPDGPNNAIVCFHIIKKYLLVGSQQGYVQVYELKDLGKEKLMNPISTLRFDSDLRSISFNFKKKEIYANNNQGIVFIDSTKGQPSNFIVAHYEPITKIQFHESHNVLVSASKDMSVKIWKIRPERDDEIKQQEEEKKLKKQKKMEQEQQYKLYEAQQKQQEYSDEDYYRSDQDDSSESSSSDDQRQSKYQQQRQLEEQKLKQKQQQQQLKLQQEQIKKQNEQKPKQKKRKLFSDDESEEDKEEIARQEQQILQQKKQEEEQKQKQQELKKKKKNILFEEDEEEEEQNNIQVKQENKKPELNQKITIKQKPVSKGNPLGLDQVVKQKKQTTTTKSLNINKQTKEQQSSSQSQSNIQQINNENENISEKIPEYQAKQFQPMRGFDNEEEQKNNNDTQQQQQQNNSEEIPEFQVKQFQPMRGFDSEEDQNTNKDNKQNQNISEEIPEYQAKQFQPMRGFDNDSEKEEKQKQTNENITEKLPEYQAKQFQPMRGFDDNDNDNNSNTSENNQNINNQSQIPKFEQFESEELPDYQVKQFKPMRGFDNEEEEQMDKKQDEYDSYFSSKQQYQYKEQDQSNKFISQSNKNHKKSSDEDDDIAGWDV